VNLGEPQRFSRQSALRGKPLPVFGHMLIKVTNMIAQIERLEGPAAYPP
jgi:hypothetical protein